MCAMYSSPCVLRSRKPSPNCADLPEAEFRFSRSRRPAGSSSTSSLRSQRRAEQHHRHRFRIGPLVSTEHRQRLWPTAEEDELIEEELLHAVLEDSHKEAEDGDTAVSLPVAESTTTFVGVLEFDDACWPHLDEAQDFELCDVSSVASSWLQLEENIAEMVEDEDGLVSVQNGHAIATSKAAASQPMSWAARAGRSSGSMAIAKAATPCSTRRPGRKLQRPVTIEKEATNEIDDDFYQKGESEVWPCKNGRRHGSRQGKKWK